MSEKIKCTFTQDVYAKKYYYCQLLDKIAHKGSYEGVEKIYECELDIGIINVNEKIYIS